MAEIVFKTLVVIFPTWEEYKKFKEEIKIHGQIKELCFPSSPLGTHVGCFLDPEMSSELKSIITLKYDTTYFETITEDEKDDGTIHG